jgi:2'-5' RNA ligase
MPGQPAKLASKPQPKAPSRPSPTQPGIESRPPRPEEHRGVTLQSGLIVAIELPAPLAAVRARFGALTSPGLPAHVTILFPFILVGSLDPSVGAALTGLSAARQPFLARFEQVQRQDSMVWLVPGPQEPFLELTAAVVARWPAYLPYGGAYDSLIAHLTLVESSSEAIARATSAALRHGPFEVLVEEVQLIGEVESGGWRELDRFRMGPDRVPAP